MSQQGILERGFGLRTLAILALLMFVGAAAFVTTRPANALGTDITVVGLDETALVIVATAAPNIAIPGGVGSESANPTISGGLALQAGSPAGTLYRTTATGGILEFVAIFTGDVALGAPLDIVTTTVSLGGINALAGPASLITNNVGAAVVFPAPTIAALAALNPTVVVVAGTDHHTFTVFSQGVAGTSTITVAAGGQTGDVLQGAGGAAPSAVFVGVANSATFGAPSVINGAGAVAPLVNPTVFGSGSAVTMAATAAGAVRNHYYHVRVLDALGARALDTAGIANITLTNITGGATISTLGSPAAASTNASVGTANELAIFVAGQIPGFGAAALATQHGSIGFGITTTLGTPASGTITVNVLGFTAVVATLDFVASGAIADITLTPAAAGDGANTGLNMTVSGGANENQAIRVTAIDTAGNPVTGAGGAIGALGGFSAANTTAGAILFGNAAAGASYAAVASGGAPAVCGPAAVGGGVCQAATAPGAAALSTAVGITGEIGATGVYVLGISPAAATAAGNYEISVSATVGATVVDTETLTVNVAGAATAGIASVADGAGTDITADPTVGINELIVITINWTTANSNVTSNGQLPGPGVNVPIATLGTITANTATNDLGNSTHTFVAGASSGLSTFTAVLGTATVQLIIEVGGTGGGVVDSLVASGDVAMNAAVGDQLQLTVVASIDGVLTANAIISFESNNSTPTPSLPSTDAAGEASSFVTSNVAGDVVVTATAVTQGVGGVLIPVQGIGAVVFTITFGATVVELSDGPVSTFLAWSGDAADSSVFDAIGGLTIVWFWNGTEWLPFVPDSEIAALRTVFVVPTFGVIFIVTTAGVSVPVS